MSRPLKLMYLDLETTGLDYVKNGIIQIAGIIEIDGVKKEEFNLKPAPFPNDVVNLKAVEAHGIPEEVFRAYVSPYEVHKALISVWDRYIDKFDKNDKLTIVAYNARFDDEFLRAWFKKLCDNYYGSYIQPYKIDIFSITGMLQVLGVLPTDNLRQETVASYLGIQYNAHDGLEDIRAGRQIFQWCCKFFNKEGVEPCQK